MPLHLSFSGIQRLFRQENSPAWHFAAEKKRTRRCFRDVFRHGTTAALLAAAPAKRTTVLLVGVVAAVVEAVALPELRFTEAVPTLGLRHLALCGRTNTNVWFQDNRFVEAWAV